MEREIERLVVNWAPEFSFTVTKVNTTATSVPSYLTNVVRESRTSPESDYYVVTWSKVTPKQPSPDAVARAIMTVDRPRGRIVSWTMENRRFVHRLDDGIPFQQSWVESIVAGKREAVFVAADLAATRSSKKRGH